MYSYLHKFHAGNFADVHKHIVLIALIEYLKHKDKPFAVLDAFAGEGIYDLSAKEAQMNKEYKEGIEALIGVDIQNDLLQHYINVVKSFNPGTVSNVQMYPGSPAIIESLLREQDKGILVENHSSSFERLKSQFNRSKKIKLHKRDAFEAMHALVPFLQKRGLIFIDPSYEVKTDYITLAKSLEKSYAKMSHGVFAIWYPILTEGLYKNLLKALLKGPYQNIYVHEWRPYPTKTKGLIGSGMVILNKGWQMEKTLSQAFNLLNKTCFQGGEHLSKTFRDA